MPTVTPEERITQSDRELHVSLDIPRHAARQIYLWARAQEWPEGTELEKPGDYHITLLYTPEGYEQHKDAYWLDHMEQAEVEISGIKAFKAQERGYAYVLLVESDEVSQKAEQMQGLAEWNGLPITKFDGGYKPHITVAYGPSSRLTSVRPPHFRFDVGPSSVSPPRIKESALKTAMAMRPEDIERYIQQYGPYLYHGGPSAGNPPRGTRLATGWEPVTENQIWFNPSGQQHGTWGRGFVHGPTQTVHTWPEAEALHADMAYAKGYQPQDVLRFDVSPQGEIRFDGYAPSLQKVVEADPRLRLKEYRVAYSPEEIQALDHLSLASIAHNLHYKFEEGGLNAELATSYAKRLLAMIGYPPDEITVQAALQTWQQLYPHDSLLESGGQAQALQAPPTVPQQSWGYGTKAKVADISTPMGFGPMYHVSPRKNREAILREGLRGHERGRGMDSPWEYSWPQPPGNYLFDNYDDAMDYVYNIHGRNNKLMDEPAPDAFGFMGDDRRAPDFEDIYEQPEPPEDFYDWPDEQQDQWYEDNPTVERTDDPEGWDIWKVNAYGLPIGPDPEPQLTQRSNDDTWDLGRVQEAYQDERERYDHPHVTPEQLHNDVGGMWGNSPKRYMIPTRIDPQRLQLHEHVPRWNLTVGDRDDRLDESYEREYPEPWSMIPFTEVPWPGHEARRFSGSEKFDKSSGDLSYPFTHTGGETLPQEQRRWAELEQMYPSQSVIAHQFPDNWTVPRHHTDTDVNRIGHFMLNCWRQPQHLDDARNNGYYYATLHDPHGIPRVAWYEHTNPWRNGAETVIEQPLGVRNNHLWQFPNSQYVPYIKDYAATKGLTFKEPQPPQQVELNQVPGFIGEPRRAGLLAGPSFRTSGWGLPGDVSPELQQILDAFNNQYGVTLMADENPHEVSFDHIEVPQENRGQGVGNRVMKQLKNYCDHTGKGLRVVHVVNHPFFNGLGWMSQAGPDEFTYEPIGNSTVPTQVNNPEDHWPEFGQQPPDRKRDIEFSNDWAWH